MFLTEKKTKQEVMYQIFIEPKGDQFLDAQNTFEQSKESWKQNLLLEIENNYTVNLKLENKDFRLIGLPFYNKQLQDKFNEAFERFVTSPKSKKSDLFFRDIISDENMQKKDKYSTHLPVYSLQAVATAFSEEQKPDLLGWKKIGIRKTLDKHMFIAQVVGRSMEPTIPDNNYCIFRFDQGGSRNGKVVLVESRQVTDPETNQKFTIKRYRSEKKKHEGDQWRHSRIILSPDNKEFDDIVLEDVSEEDFRVVAEFISVL